MSLVALHGARTLIWVIIGANALVGLWGLVAGRRVGVAFWTALAGLAVLLGVQVLAGVLLLLAGSMPATPLHFIYGALAVAGIAGQVGLRPGAFLQRVFVAEPERWNAGRFLGLWSLTLAAALMRAYQTGIRP